MIFRGRLFDPALGLLDLPLQLREFVRYRHACPLCVVLDAEPYSRPAIGAAHQ
jgi:hypothetical protein